MTALAWLAAALVLAGIAYQLGSAAAVARTLDKPALSTLTPPAESMPVSILKPLYGAEPALVANLRATAAQDYGAPFEILCGVARADDPAAAVVAALAAADPRFRLVVDAARHGANAKVSNLVNLAAEARHELIVVADSDMAVGPDWLARVTAALAVPGVGAVTCLYHGRGDAGGWSRLAAMGISHGFLPSVATGLVLGLARPCMGSTIALRRETLAAIGGFAAFADVLADDHALGEAVRGLGLAVAIPGFSIAHGCAETSLAALAAHELRWNLTIRRLDPLGYLGFGLMNPLPVALLALPLLPAAAAAALVAASLAARLTVAAVVDRATGAAAGPFWWLPARDLLSFALFLSSFTRRTARWRGARLAVAADGRIAA